jgi:hypothetical protein
MLGPVLCLNRRVAGRSFAAISAVTVLVAFMACLLPGSASAWSGGGAKEPVDFTQFDFWGLSIAPEPETIGSELRIVNVLVPETSFLPITLEPLFYEYTLYLSGVRLRTRTVNGAFITSTYHGGYLDVFADPTFNAPFRFDTQNPPPLDPLVVPSTFEDGELLVRFEVRGLTTIFYQTAGIGSVAYTASELRLVGGSALPVFQDEHMIVGWHLGGGFTNQPGTVPPGYGMRYDLLVRWENPLPVGQATWGGIKATFR